MKTAKELLDGVTLADLQHAVDLLLRFVDLEAKIKRLAERRGVDLTKPDITGRNRRA